MLQLSITLIFHPLTEKKITRRKVRPKGVPAIARSRDASNYIANALQLKGFVRDAIVLTVAILLKLVKSGKRQSKTRALKIRKHSRIDSAWKIRKAENQHRRFITWVVNAKSLHA